MTTTDINLGGGGGGGALAFVQDSIIWANEPFGTLTLGSTYVDTQLGIPFNIPAVASPGSMSIYIDGSGLTLGNGIAGAPNQVFSLDALISDMVASLVGATPYDVDLDVVEVAHRVSGYFLNGTSTFAQFVTRSAGGFWTFNSGFFSVGGVDYKRGLKYQASAPVPTTDYYDVLEGHAASRWLHRVQGSKVQMKYASGSELGPIGFGDLTDVDPSVARWALSGGPTTGDLSDANMVTAHAMEVVGQAAETATMTISETIIRIRRPT